MQQNKLLAEANAHLADHIVQLEKQI